jgi:hypothetical protein
VFIDKIKIPNFARNLRFGTNKTLNLLLPELLISHFNLTNSRVEKEVVHLNFEEKKDIPKEM